MKNTRRSPKLLGDSSYNRMGTVYPKEWQFCHWLPHAGTAAAAAEQRKELMHKRNQFEGESEQQEAEKQRQRGPGRGWRQEKAQD
ncbi:hypothetical protein L3X38_013338 [Prunus dulcis]|uniref:Uncharacterized protein n=1 Tax=Prunus dulcis TaxID=3755 RepID=A0AAD4WLS2_PRUDU|nr:hypothetical protein L3X38_013338 [Prunus dulcis]